MLQLRRLGLSDSAKSKLFISRPVHVEIAVDEITIVHDSLIELPLHRSVSSHSCSLLFHCCPGERQRDALPEHRECRMEQKNYVTIYST